MTEMTDIRKTILSPVAQKFILHWGEMGTRWGVNRTVAQVHALLFLSPHPLAADEIARALSVARSNVSTSLRELQGWRIVRVAPVLGDRRQHFESMTDPWEMFRVILEERKRREIDPTIAVLRECVGELGRAGEAEIYARERIAELLEFVTTMSSLYEEFQRLPPAATRGLLKLRGRVRKLLHG
jgi:DNA-binding transcriptional regulator GbsR (MarR family)